MAAPESWRSIEAGPCAFPIDESDANLGSGWSVRHLTSEDSDFESALHAAILGRLRGSDRPRHPHVANLLADTASGPLRIELVRAAYRDNVMHSAALAVRSPDGSALVYFSSGRTDSEGVFACGLVLRSLVAAAWRASYIMLEVLLSPELTAFDAELGIAGFRKITRLNYLSRATDAPIAALASDVKSGLNWVVYDEAMSGFFEEAIERSEAQSQDCPELTAIRTARQALAAHRAVGAFDPRLWFVCKQGVEPVGVLLLSALRREPIVEIVYMGVAQPARGTGVANALMRRAVESARSVSAKLLALAVDERNAPARRLYHRWGFVEIGSRSAYIATPDAIES